MADYPSDKPPLMSNLPCSGLQHGWYDSWVLRTTTAMREALEKYLRELIRDGFRGYVHVYLLERGQSISWRFVSSASSMPRDASDGTHWLSTYDLTDVPLRVAMLATAL